MESRNVKGTHQQWTLICYAVRYTGEYPQLSPRMSPKGVALNEPLGTVWKGFRATRENNVEPAF